MSRKLHDRARDELRASSCRSLWPEIAALAKKYELTEAMDRSRDLLELILRVDHSLAKDDRAAMEERLAIIAVSRPWSDSRWNR